MDPTRFDTLTKSLGQARSRRTVFKTLGVAALGALGLGTARPTGAAPGGNSACAAFCAQVFGDTRAAGQCTSAAAHGQGLCYQCGPASDQSQKPCGQTCIPTSSCCVDLDCADNDVCTTDQCVNGQCAYTLVDCDDHNPCTTDFCDPQSGCAHTTVADGTGCTTASVPNGTCQSGQCVAICGETGARCTSNTECCSGNCPAGGEPGGGPCGCCPNGCFCSTSDGGNRCFQFTGSDQECFGNSDCPAGEACFGNHCHTVCM